MAVALVGTIAAMANVNVGSITGAFGAGQNATQGNLLVAVVTGSGATSVSAIAEGSGLWTAIGGVNQGQDVIAMWSLVRGAGAATAPTFTCTISGTGGMTCAIAELSGQDAATPVATTGTATGTSAGAITATTAGNVPNANCLAIAGAGIGLAVAAPDAWTPTGWVAGTNNGGNTRAALGALDTRTAPPSGATLAYAGTWATNSSQTKMVAVFQPPLAALVPDLAMAPMTGV